MDTYSKKFQPVICAPWTPTDAAFDRYLAREVELARENLKKAHPHGQTLHSPAVVAKALRLRPAQVQILANISVRTKLDGRWIGQA